MKYDEETHACFQNDYFNQIEMNSNSKRNLLACGDATNCYDCGRFGSVCAWDGTTCGAGDNDKQKRWFENYELCTDTLNICYNEP